MPWRKEKWARHTYQWLFPRLLHLLATSKKVMNDEHWLMSSYTLKYLRKYRITWFSASVGFQGFWYSIGVHWKSKIFQWNTREMQRHKRNTMFWLNSAFFCIGNSLLYPLFSMNQIRPFLIFQMFIQMTLANICQKKKIGKPCPWNSHHLRDIWSKKTRSQTMEN